MNSFLLISIVILLWIILFICIQTYEDNKKWKERKKIICRHIRTQNKLNNITIERIINENFR